MDDFKVKDTLEKETRERIKSKLKKLSYCKSKKPCSAKDQKKSVYVSPNKYRITIEGLEYQYPAVFEYDHIVTEEERGLEFNHSPNGEVKIQSNGQQRMRIELWSGCKSFADFRDKIISYSKEEEDDGQN